MVYITVRCVARCAVCVVVCTLCVYCKACERVLIKVIPLLLPQVLGTLLILYFSALGLILFENTAEEVVEFPNLGEGMKSLLVLLTTANFPDVMMPAYQEQRWSALFFIVFLLIGLFFLMNLILATIYNHYKTEVDKDRVQKV